MISNATSCPVCRYELPVDDQEYEQDRKRRMADRQIHEDELTSEDDEPQAKNQKREEETATEDVPEIPLEEPIERPSIHHCGMSKLHGNEPCFLLEEEHYCTCTCSHTFHEECLQSFLRVCGTLEPAKDLSDVGMFTCPQCRADTTILPVLDVD